jgi:glutaredoxin
MITIYSKHDCPACENLVRYLETRNISFTKLILGEDYTREELIALVPGAKSLPQCFVDRESVGGLAGVTVALKNKGYL